MRQRLWQQSGAHSSPATRWQAYLNRLSLHAVVQWLREDEDRNARPWPRESSIASVLELTHGAAVQLSDGTRFTVVADEATDDREVCIPQEWVDIPSWAAQYYVAAQVEPEEGWVRLWGFATREQVIVRGRYDAGDRSYCLDSEALTQDISLLNVTRELCPVDSPQSEVVPLPPLPLAQVESLVQRLGNPELVLPRLAVPFQQWGALLEHDGWRQRLYRQRAGLPDWRSVTSWLREGVSDVAAQLGWQRLQVAEGVAGARGAATQAEALLSKSVTIGDRAYHLRVIPQGELNEGRWRFELTPDSGRIPAGTTLRLLTEDLQPFEGNADEATTEVEALFVDVAIASGEGIVWEVTPTPADYEREILRF